MLKMKYALLFIHKLKKVTNGFLRMQEIYPPQTDACEHLMKVYNNLKISIIVTFSSSSNLGAECQ